MSATLPAPGETVRGKYRVEHLIGKGGMGVVFAASHLRLQQRVALKVLRPELLEDADCVTRFDREARAAAKMTSPHAARIFDVDTTEGGIPFFVMELFEGEDLSNYFRNRGKLPCGQAVDIVLQAAAALAEAHQLGVIHRDLKLGNLFLAGPDRTVKVLDFGISKLLGETSQNTSTAMTLGTPHYMAPEQMLGAKSINGQADIWSLGVILYRLVSGRFPFDGANPAEIAVMVATTTPAPFVPADEVPDGLAAVIRRALERDRAIRWPDVASLAAALAPFREAWTDAPPRDSVRALLQAAAPQSSRTPPSMKSLPALPAAPVAASVDVPSAPHPATETGSAAHAVTTPTYHEQRPRARALPAVLGVLGTLLVVGIILTAISATKRFAPTAAAPASPSIAATPEIATPPPPPTGIPTTVLTAIEEPADAGSTTANVKLAPVVTAAARPRPAASAPLVRPAPAPAPAPPPAPPTPPTSDPRRL